MAKILAHKGDNMATTLDFMEYICDQIRGVGAIRYRKMFGEYMVYIDEKPILLVCDNVVFVKCFDCVKEKMKEAEKGFPYSGAKEHYILDIDNSEFCKEVITLLEQVITIPKPKKKK